jgi:hypothetical protein
MVIEHNLPVIHDWFLRRSRFGVRRYAALWTGWRAMVLLAELNFCAPSLHRPRLCTILIHVHPNQA